MNTKKPSPVVVNKSDLWFKIIPLLLTAAGLAFGVYQWVSTHKKNSSQQDSWQTRKTDLRNVSALIGKISASADNDSLLKIYALTYEEQCMSKAKYLAGDDSLMIYDMIMLKKDLQNQLVHKIDINNPGKLKTVATRLNRRITDEITKTDREF